MKKKLLTLTLAAVMMLALCGCGGDKQKQSDASADNAGTNVTADTGKTADAAGTTQGNASDDTAKVAPADDFTFEDSGDGIAITGYTGTASDLIIPDEIDGKPVTTIREDAFGAGSSDTLEKITVPDSVTKIESWAFSNCLKLKSVYIGSGVTSLSINTIVNCPELESVILPNSIGEIDENFSPFLDCGDSLQISFYPSTGTQQ